LSTEKCGEKMPERKPEIKAVNRVYSGKYINCNELSYINKAGNSKTYEMVSMHDICSPEDIGSSVSGISVLAFDTSGKILLLKEFRMAVNGFVYNLCAGMLENGETAEECAARELREETGITDIEVLDVLKPCFAAVALSDIQNQLVALRVSCSGQKVPCSEENENIIPGFYDREQTRRLLETAYFSSRAQLAAYLYAKGMLDASLL
jgi:ADP-ribose pyrophosphatase